ncbi:galactokinase [Novosphingobium sp.]|uniref:galactokinase n=1 Tax=Novosphingobium sp. TaxID=1874826 RepID=UPI0025DC02D8|nr:galactokinase [Novosphingobium sp.]
MTVSDLAARFTAAFGHVPQGTVFAPGRVNLIGEHLDYNGGMVLPMPISSGTQVAWSPRDDGMISALACDFAGDPVTFTPQGDLVGAPGDWASYVQGMAHSCAARGIPQAGANLAISGTMPRGSGLSSSASLCVAVGRALCAAAGIAQPDQQLLAEAAQTTEHDFAGVRCGIMDQMAVAHAAPGQALALDCGTLAFTRVALPRGWTVLIVQSGVERGLVDGEYNARRQDCEVAASALGAANLAHASADDLARAGLDARVLRRARHVITEQARTQAAIAALQAADLVTLGRLMRESHASLRDDFEVSVPAVDALVDVLNQAIGQQGGARMTGGGFGGAVVAALHDGQVEAVLCALQAGYRTPQGGPAPIMLERGAASAD